jgi:hypothetical protein
MLLDNLWSAEEDAVIVQGRKDGLSAAQIALKLIGGRVPRSRNAVIGRSNRLSLPPLENCSALRARVQRKKEKPKPLPVRATAPSLPIDSSLAVSLAPTFFDPPPSECLTFSQMVKADSCRWPIGDDGFCPHIRMKTIGCKRYEPYCAHHHSVAHGKQKSAPMRKLPSLLVRW